MAGPRIAQLALCSSDLPATIRRYAEVFGFADAGGRVFWGPWLAGIQGLGDDAATVLWWMVGRQDLMQLEFFHHTLPAIRPRPADWRASDHGWTGFALAVPDFEEAIGRLRASGIETITSPVTHDGLRRVAFRDPDLGVVVEVLEEGEATPGGIRPRHYDLAPAVVSVTLSVGDIGRARAFFVDVVGLEPVDGVRHPPELERGRGLAGARRDAFVLRGGDAFLEVVRYDEPAGRPPPADARLSDQGMMNMAVAFRERERSDALLERIRAAGHHVGADLPDTPAGGVYATDDQGNSLEVIACPREFDGDFGFVPAPQLLRPARWPSTDVPPARA